MPHVYDVFSNWLIPSSYDLELAPTIWDNAQELNAGHFTSLEEISCKQGYVDEKVAMTTTWLSVKTVETTISIWYQTGRVVISSADFEAARLDIALKFYERLACNMSVLKPKPY